LPERANLQYATPGLFKLLGVHPSVGRLFSESEADFGAQVMLGHGLWVRRYGSDSSIVGKKIVVNGEVRTVRGVLPKDFHLFDMGTDIWMPIALPDARSQDRSFRSWLIAVGRLRHEATLMSAQAEMDVISQRIALANPASNKDWKTKIEPIQEAQYGSWKNILYPLWGAVIFVLLISCANVANVLLGRLAARTREIALRVSLGATRRRLIIQLLNEGLLVGLAGGVIGFLLTGWGIHLFEAFAPSDFPLLNSIRLNVTVLLFCLASAVLSGILLAIIPALIGTRLDLNTALKRASRSSLGRHHGLCRSLFASVQIALSVALLMGAGLMIRSLLGVLSVDPGFQKQDVITMQMFLSGPRYFVWSPNGVGIHNEVENFYTRLLDRTQALPGVRSAAVASWLPEMGYNTGRRDRAFRIAGQAEEGIATQTIADFNPISADYFETLQIPILAGRSFKRTDTGTGPWVAIVNRTFVDRYFQGGSAIGKAILISDRFDRRLREIVGVVADVHQDSLEQRPTPEIFIPYQQQPQIAAGHGYQNRVHMNLVVKVKGNPDATVAAIRKIAAEMDANQPVYGVRTMSTTLAETTALRRLHAMLVGIFAAFALFLAAIGLYSVVSQTVAERTAEIGLRMAIGATSAKIYRLVFTQGLNLIACGMISGLAIGFLGSRLLSSFLFGISPHDPETLAVVWGLLLAVSFFAIWPPAWRAMRIDPIIALRDE
jgi:putative ABC transport system permease protein